jgi:hypothetical protein
MPRAIVQRPAMPAHSLRPVVLNLKIMSSTHRFASWPGDFFFLAISSLGGGTIATRVKNKESV